MSIGFNCTCGKKLQAPDEFAGRRMKCKSCGEISTIPGERPAVVAATAKTPGKAAAKKAAKPAAPSKPKPAPRGEVKKTTAKPLAKQATTQLPEKKTPPPLEAPPPPPKPLLAPAAPAQLPRAEPNLWVDRSFDQRSTAWQHGDEHVAGASEKERGGIGLLGYLMLIVLVAGLAEAGWYFWPR